MVAVPSRLCLDKLANEGALPCRQNDICSFKKDVDTGETANILFLLKDQGMTTQEAADRVGQMLHDCYRRWYSHLVALPYWGNNIDRQVLKYIEGCRNLALGNLTWR